MSRPLMRTVMSRPGIGFPTRDVVIPRLAFLCRSGVRERSATTNPRRLRPARLRVPDVADGPQTYVRRLDDVDAAVPITVRRYDLGGELLHPHRRPDGTLLCEGRSVREGVLEYRRADGSIHRELVTRQALIDTAKSGARATMTLDHPPEGFVSPDSAQRLMTGDVDGTPAVEEDAQGGFVRVRVALRRRDAIDAFDSGKARQLSWGYEAILDETPGEHPGFG